MEESEADFASESFLVDIEARASPELSHLMKGGCDQVIAESCDGVSVEKQLDEDTAASRFSPLNHGLEKRGSSFFERGGFLRVEIGESEEFGLRQFAVMRPCERQCRGSRNPSMTSRGLRDLEFALVAPALQRRFADAQGVGYGSRRVGSFRHFRVECVLQARGGDNSDAVR